MNTISLLLLCGLTLSGSALAPLAEDVNDVGGQETESKARPQRSFVALRATAAPDSGDGWLGVRLETPPPALEAHLRLDGTGLLITNIVKDSPAQHCGAAQYDVIVEFAGEDVTQNVAELAQRIRQIKAGNQVEIDVLRAGQTLKLKPIIDSRQAHLEHSWIYEDQPDQVFKHVISLRGKVLETGPGGDVVVKDIGEFENVPMPFMALVPDFKEAQVALYDDDGQVTRKISAVKDGVRIEIEQLPDERIRVERISTEDDDQLHSEEIYAGPEELREADEEAFELRFNAARFTGDDLLFEPAGFVFNSAADDLGPDLTHWILDYETLAPGSEEQRKALAELNKVITRHIHERDVVGSNAAQDAASAEMTRAWMEQVTEHLHQILETHEKHSDHPKYEFQELADGRIEVTFRRGDAALIQTYADVAELQSKTPGLYERYVALKSSE